MILGEASLITIGVANLSASKAFYGKLGFHELESSERPNPWSQITDGRVILWLNQESNSNYVSLTYFSKDARERAKKLQDQGLKFHYISSPEKKLFQGIFVTPDKLAVNLMNLDPSRMFKPNKPTLREIPMDRIKSPDAYPNPHIGAFGEFSHPVKSLMRAIDFWHYLGFKPVSINEKPYPWAIISDGINLIGLHQSTDLEYPALSYFAPDMMERIQRLRDNGINNIFAFRSRDGDTPRNAVLKSPDGQHMLLFNL